MAGESEPDKRIWWIVGVALALLLLCLCGACVVAAGAASFLSVRSGETRCECSTPSPERVVPQPEATVPAMPIPTPDVEPDFRMQSGAHILGIVAGSPADQIGWRPGDVIAKVDGRALGSNYDLRQALSGKRPGDMVAIEWWSRQTRELQTVRVQLGSNPDGSGRAYLGIEYRMRP